MKYNKIWIYAISLILFSGVVSAALNINAILSPFNGSAIASFYLSYYAFIDALIYLILFLSLSQIAFIKIYAKNAAPGVTSNRKESKMIAVAVALALTASMTILEMNTGFNLGQLYPIALVIFLLVLAILLYNLMCGLFPPPEEKKPSKVAAALTYLIIYGLIIVPFGTLYTWMERNAPLLASILTLGTIAAFIFLIIEMIGLFSGGDTTGKPGPQGPAGAPGMPGQPGTPGEPGQTPPPAEVPPVPPNTTPQPNQPGQTPQDDPNNTTSDVTALWPKLIVYSQTLHNARNKAKEFAVAAINVGNQAVLYDTNNAPNPPTVTDWQRLNKAQKELLDIMDEVNNQLHNILNDPLFPSLQGGDLVQFNNVATLHTVLAGIISDFYNKFVTNINSTPVLPPPHNAFNNMI